MEVGANSPSGGTGHLTGAQGPILGSEAPEPELRGTVSGADKEGGVGTVPGPGAEPLPCLGPCGKRRAPHPHPILNLWDQQRHPRGQRCSLAPCEKRGSGFAQPEWPPPSPQLQLGSQPHVRLGSAPDWMGTCCRGRKKEPGTGLCLLRTCTRHKIDLRTHGSEC